MSSRTPQLDTLGSRPENITRRSPGPPPAAVEMKRKNTILVVPSKGAPLRRLELSNRQLLGLCAALLGVTALAVVSLWAFFAVGVSQTDLARLEAENDELRSVNLRFEEELDPLRARLADFEERTQKLAIVAGLDLDQASGEAGIGGEVVPPALDGPLDALAGRAEGLGTRLEAIEAAFDRRTARFSSTPSIAPAIGLLTSGFGYRTDPLTGTRSYHRGIDIGTGPDQPVVAAADGLVVQAGPKGDLGRTVHLSHGFGYTTRYGHLSRIVVRPGERIEQGGVVGFVGSSGRSTGYHLHYEVRRDGRPLDPLAYLLDGLGES